MIRPAIKLILVMLAMLLITFVADIFRRIGKIAACERIMSFCSTTVLCLAGVKVKVIGEQAKDRPLLVVANHLSYMDVPILSSHAVLNFTPKIEMKSWPLFGWMCKVQGSIFVDRRPEKVKEVGEGIRATLRNNKAVCLFPEGTTGNGLHMLPFKSSFFGLAEEAYNDKELWVQPVAIAYRRIRNLPIDMTQWPEIAWYGDMELLPHLWNLLKIAPISAELTYLPPVKLEQFGNRKALSAHCESAIARVLR